MKTAEEIRLKILRDFKDLTFEEKYHTYHLGDKKLPSVSKKLKEFYEPFNRGIAKFSAKKEGITEKEILERWDKKRDAAAEFGSKVHNFGELYTIECARASNYAELGIIQWWIDLNDKYELITTELPVFNEELGYAGTPDILLWNTETQKVVIGDYKTNEDLFKNYKGKKLKGPFEKNLDMPLNRYTIQLNLYQMCLESKGYEVEDRIIIWLKEDVFDCRSKFYQEYRVPDHTIKLNEYYGNDSRTYINFKTLDKELLRR